MYEGDEGQHIPHHLRTVAHYFQKILTLVTSSCTLTPGKQRVCWPSRVSGKILSLLVLTLLTSGPLYLSIVCCFTALDHSFSLKKKNLS